jgi:hypothetical protein
MTNTQGRTDKERASNGGEEKVWWQAIVGGKTVGRAKELVRVQAYGKMGCPTARIWPTPRQPKDIFVVSCRGVGQKTTPQIGRNLLGLVAE